MTTPRKKTPAQQTRAQAKEAKALLLSLPKKVQAALRAPLAKEAKLHAKAYVVKNGVTSYTKKSWLTKTPIVHACDPPKMEYVPAEPEFPDEKPFWWGTGTTPRGVRKSVGRDLEKDAWHDLAGELFGINWMFDLPGYRKLIKDAAAGEKKREREATARVREILRG